MHSIKIVWVPNHVWLKQLILQYNHSNTNTIPLQQIIPSTLWHLSNTQNKNCFESLKLKPYPNMIYQLANEYYYLTTSSLHKRIKLPMYVKWEPPHMEFLS